MGTKWRPRKDEAEHFKKLEKSNQGYLDRTHTPEKWGVKTMTAPLVAPDGKTKVYKSEANSHLLAHPDRPPMLVVKDYKKTIDGKEIKTVPAKQKSYDPPRQPATPIVVPKGSIPRPPPPPPKRNQIKKLPSKKPASRSVGNRLARCVGRLCGKVGR